MLLERDLTSNLFCMRDAESSDGVCNFILYFVKADASDASTLKRSTPKRMGYNLSMYFDEWSLN
jgi:hypothetical protein